MLLYSEEFNEIEQQVFKGGLETSAFLKHIIWFLNWFFQFIGWNLKIIWEYYKIDIGFVGFVGL